jgi:hypothetical protein
MGKYDWCFIQKKDGIYEQDHAFYHGGGGEGRQMIWATGGLLGPNFTLGYGVADTPHTLKPDTVKNEYRFLDCEHLLCFLSNNLYDLEDFDADIEVTLGGEKHVFNEPTIVRIPPFVEDGPINFKRIGKPFCFMHIVFSSSFHIPGKPRAIPDPPTNPTR